MYSAPDMLDLLHYLAFMWSAVIGAMWVTWRAGKVMLEAIFLLADMMADSD